MKWNNESGFLTFQTSINGIKNSLGITNLVLTDRCELVPYYTYILKYLNERLILLGDVSKSEKIKEVFNIFNYGAEKIILNATLDLAWDLGIDTTDYYREGSYIPYNQEYLVFSWSNLMTELCTILRLYYPLQVQGENTSDCSCSCAPGLTTEDIESWSSGVYPEDSCYEKTTESNFWRSGAETEECTKCYRI